MKEKVLNYDHLYKVDGFYFVNEDEEGYRMALLRHKKEQEDRKLKERIDNLESKMDLILKLLQEKN